MTRHWESMDVSGETGQALEHFIDLVAARTQDGTATAHIESTKSDDPEVRGQSLFIMIGDSGVNLVLSTGMPGHKGLQLEIREVFGGLSRKP